MFHQQFFRSFHNSIRRRFSPKYSTSSQYKSPIDKYLVYSMPTISFGVFLYEAFHYYQLENSFKEKFKRTLLEPITLNRVLTEDEKNEYEFRPFKVTGHFLHEREMIIYPKYHNKQLGFHLYTPFKIKDGPTIIINRGWVPSALKDIKKRQEINPIDEVSLQGHLINGDQPFQFSIFGHKIMESVNIPENDSWNHINVKQMAEWAFTEPILLFSNQANNIGGLPEDENLIESRFVNPHIKNSIISFSFTFLMVAMILTRRFKSYNKVSRVVSPDSPLFKRKK